MRLFPRSLFGRIALILAGGFLAIQLITTAIAISDRNALVFRAGANQAATRIGDVVRTMTAASPAERTRIMQAISNDTLKVIYGKPAGSDAAAGEDSELMTTARDALALALPPGVGFRVIDARPVYLNPGSWYAREFGERPGVRMYATVLLNDGVWITVESIDPARATQWVIRMFRNLAIIDGVMVILCFFAVRLVTRPLSVLAHAAEDLGRNIDRPPLPERGANELVRASRALNVMQDRLKRYVDTRMKVLAAMSHDLKTPITRMRLRAEMLDDAHIKAKFIKDLDELQQMVGSTLDYMRGLAEGGEAVQPIDVTALISSLKEDAEEAGHTITVSGDARTPVMGRAQALKRCLQNLIDNALAYGRRADITLRDEGGALNIAISDNGPGIPEDDIERVFEPFYRVEGSRNRNTGGSGLGLSIARNIAQAHGGSVRLRNLARGGLEATLRIPRGA
ncbi:MAG: HAMP domain-containing protein [Betaproteobacteria bacterium]|nr:HAMP domain-containing protein [Betaproteobacteria bacterium]